MKPIENFTKEYLEKILSNLTSRDMCIEIDNSRYMTNNYLKISKFIGINEVTYETFDYHNKGLVGASTDDVYQHIQEKPIDPNWKQYYTFRFEPRWLYDKFVKCFETAMAGFINLRSLGMKDPCLKMEGMINPNLILMMKYIEENFKEHSDEYLVNMITIEDIYEKGHFKSINHGPYNGKYKFNVQGLVTLQTNQTKYLLNFNDKIIYNHESQ